MILLLSWTKHYIDQWLGTYNILYIAVGIVARFSTDPEETHMIVVKMIFKYLKEHKQ